MFRMLAACLLILSVGVTGVPDATAAEPSPPAAVASTSATDADRSAIGVAKFDPSAATEMYMNRLQGEARAKSDAYAEGGYWLLLWNLLYGLAVAWLLLASRISARLRDFAQRRTHRRNLQTLLYVLGYVPLAALLSLPLTVYEGFYREHLYGLSNLYFAGWLAEALIGLAVNLVLLGIAVTGFYAILRRAPRTWWAWGTVAGTGFMMVLFMIGPVFIAPLFNTYEPLPEGPVRDEILSLARANGIPADNVHVFDASRQTKRISANVSGLFGTTRISLNDNLLRRTSLPEIRAVMAHEMGHYVLSHSLKLTVSFTLLLLGGLLFLKFSWGWAASRFANRHGVHGIADPAGLPVLVALFSVYMFLMTPAFNTIIRSAETEADLFGLNAAREPEGFAEAIFKLAEYRKLEPGALEEIVFFDHPGGHTRIFAAMRWKAENLK